jgi:hypothetical protein
MSCHLYGRGVVDWSTYPLSDHLTSVLQIGEFLSATRELADVCKQDSHKSSLLTNAVLIRIRKPSSLSQVTPSYFCLRLLLQFSRFHFYPWQMMVNEREVAVYAYTSDESPLSAIHGGTQGTAVQTASSCMYIQYGTGEGPVSYMTRAERSFPPNTARRVRLRYNIRTDKRHYGGSSRPRVLPASEREDAAIGAIPRAARFVGGALRVS